MHLEQTLMKKLIFSILCCAAFALSCDKGDASETDSPTIWFEAEEYTLPAAGGIVTIPVHSTGVDYATIKYTFEDAWDFNSEGNMVPREGWIDLEVIPNYPESRDLMTGRSGIKLIVEANTAIANRTAWLIVGSFSQTQSVVLHQPSVNAKQ